MIGKLLDHRYKVIKVLAKGGFGQTYIAQDTKRPGHPICVVKHLKPVNSDSKMVDTAKRLFHNEAETLEKLGNHHQIPRLLAYFDEACDFYLVQEFIEGHTLSEELLPHKPWTESQVVELLQEVLAILKFVHFHGVIHRDIKPDNIIRRASDGKLVLVDFGAVKQLRVASSYLSRTLMFTTGGYPSATIAVGTPGYMPTEQGQGKPRPNSDIYALGIIAIQALTGVGPMDLQEDPHTGEILWQHLVPVSHELAVVLSKMVCYHFKDRYQSASEALQALDSLPSISIEHAYPKSLTYQPIRLSSPQSQQKTIAVAPAHPIAKATPAISQLSQRGSGGLDLLQLTILACLATSAAAVTPAVVEHVQDFTAKINLASTNTNTDDSIFITDKPASKPKPVINTDINTQPSLRPQSSKTPSVSKKGSLTLERATDKYEAQDLRDAMALLKSVSSNHPAVNETGEMITQWQEDWAKAEALFQDIDTALAQGQWSKVLAYKKHPEKLPNIQYWQNKIEPLFKKAAENLASQQPLTEAKPDNHQSQTTSSPKGK
jgi:serine/threonine-protein kinase